MKRYSYKYRRCPVCNKKLVKAKNGKLQCNNCKVEF